MRYRRNRVSGGCYFFTVVTRDRIPVLTKAEARALISKAFHRVRRKYPFRVDAIVLLPDHLHCVWTLPDEDDDFSTRWRLIKRWVSANASSRLIARPRVGKRSALWQGRFWERTVRSEKAYARIVDYIHYNPVRHGYVRSAASWPYSSFGRYCALGRYPVDWRVPPDGGW